MKTQVALVWLMLAACSGSGAKKPDTNTPSSASATTEEEATASDKAAPKPAAGKSLFDRLGGKGAITAVTDEFINRVAADIRIKHRFFNTDIVKLKGLLVEFVCMATGGPCKYTGQDMETTHAGMDLVDEEFTALVEDLAGALDKFKVPAKEKGELLGALGPLKPQMVVTGDRLKPVSDALIAEAAAAAKTIPKDNKLAAEIMAAAIVAAKRGQRSYAEQLFSRVEFVVGNAKLVAEAAPAFRDGAPPRVATPTRKMPKDTPPQPTMVGSSDVDEPDKKPTGTFLQGSVTVNGKPLKGLGTVMLFPVGGGGKKRIPKQRIVEQRDKTFAPHVIAVPVGSTIAFPNFDGIYHNVFSVSKTKPFDVGLYKDGETRDVKFDKPGIVRLGCNIHAKMSAYVLVVDAPHYVVVDGATEFKFASLKPGKYKVRAWSENSAKPAESELTIKAGENIAKFDVKGDADAGPSEDKFGMPRTPTR